MNGQWAALPTGHVEGSSSSKREKGEEKMKRLRWIWQGDVYLRLVTLMAVIASLASFAYFYSQDLTLACRDGLSRLMIARRVIDNVTPGLAQLGGVWLPLPNILMLSTIWNDFMYWSGLAGSIVSMISFVLATVFICKIALLLTENKGAGLIAAFIFAINPNVLYMQSTPMSELPAIAFLVAGVYFLMKWGQNVDNLKYLFLTALAVLGATLTRYEGWVLLASICIALVYTFIRKRFNYQKAEGHLVYFGTLAGLGVFLWLVWNQVIFGDFLYFQNSEYSFKNCIQSGLTVLKPTLRTSNNLSLSSLTLYEAVVANSGLIIFWLGVLGLAYFLFSSRLKTTNVVVVLIFLVFPAFYILEMYRGEVTIWLPELTEGRFWNTRHGMTLVPFIAFFAAYLTKRRLWPKVLVIGLVVVSTVMMVQKDNIITLNEAVADKTSNLSFIEISAARWLEKNYDSGRILFQSYGNEQTLFYSKIRLNQFVNEGNANYWRQALKDPKDEARWVFMRGRGGATPDKVWKALHGMPQLLDNYDLVYQDKKVEIYKRKAY